MTREGILIADQLGELFDDMPDLVLYKNEISTTEISEVERIISIGEEKDLNPLEVVLESLVNVLSEKLSVGVLTSSRTMACVNNSTRQQAIEQIIKLVKNDGSILRKMHGAWLRELRDFLNEMKVEGIQTLQEVLFKVSFKFRISATSSIKAIATVMHMP